MPLPYDNILGPLEVCHNTFVNGKAVFEDIYTSDKSNWVSAEHCMHCNYNIG